MYIHIGQDVVVRKQDIVGIFDLENTTISRTTRDYLAQAEKQGKVVTVCDDIPKSFLVCRDRDKRETVYISQISCATLLKRAVRSGRNEKMRGSIA